MNQRECLLCGTSGQITVYVELDEGPGVWIEKNCPKCDGTGFIPDEEFEPELKGPK